MRIILKKLPLFFIAAAIFCHNITAMDSNTMNCDCCEFIRMAIGTPIVIQQSFTEYQNIRGKEPLKLVFPAGRCLFNPDDLRGDQQKHEGFIRLMWMIVINVILI